MEAVHSGDGERVRVDAEETTTSSESVSGMKGEIVAGSDSMRPSGQVFCWGETVKTAPRISARIPEKMSRSIWNADELKRANMLNVPMMITDKMKTNSTAGETSSA